MKIRMIFAALAGISAMAMLWSCVENPPPPHTDSPAFNSGSLIPPSSATKPIVLTKPPMLGPPSPNIVILPPRIAEPEIRVRLTEESNTPPAIDRTKYRGRLENLRLPDGKYVTINSLPLDSYLQGVLAKELYGSWDPATYRAQAVAARTFALFEMMTDGRSKQWDVNDDQSSQVYGGIAGETAKARQAVADTRGQVLTATVSGRTGIFCARFSACIGGASQDPFDAWGDPSVPPLAAQVTGNVDDNATRFNWGRDFTITRADATRCIQNWGARNGFSYLQSLGNIVSIVISQRNSATQRPVQLTLTDAGGKSAPIRAEEFRLALINDPAGKAPKPYSSNCDIRSQGDAFILFNGHGYGHGIGLSQWGAQNLATRGYSHTRILAFFYPGSGLQTLW